MKVSYVNVYLTDRQYGGPEEGGWWFDSGEARRTIPVRPKQALRCLHRVLRVLECRNRDENRRPASSMLCDGWWDAFIEDHPAADFPEARPHYE